MPQPAPMSDPQPAPYAAYASPHPYPAGMLQPMPFAQPQHAAPARRFTSRKPATETRAPIEEIRESLREFREAVRDLAEKPGAPASFLTAKYTCAFEFTAPDGALTGLRVLIFGDNARRNEQLAGGIMAEIIDGKAVGEDVVAKVKTLTAELVASGGTAARPCGGHRRRGSGKPGLRRVQDRRRPRNAASIRCSTRCRPKPARANCSHSSATLNADPAINGILVQLPLPAHIDSGRDHPDHRAGKGCRRLSFHQCRQARHRRTGHRLRAVHAGRLDAADRARARQGSFRPQRRRRRPLQHRRQADGQSAACRQLHGDHRPQPHAATCRRLCRTADILVAAVGRPEMVKGDWVKPGATVIDVGINRIAGAGKGRGQVAAGRRRRLRRRRKRWPAPSRRCRAASGR